MRWRHGHTPRYSLQRVQELVAAGPDHYHITNSARFDAQLIGFDEEDIVECIRDLTEADYEQTLRSTKIPGTFQDVYKPRFFGREVYLKIRLRGDHEAVVISFKRNTST